MLKYNNSRISLILKSNIVIVVLSCIYGWFLLLRTLVVINAILRFRVVDILWFVTRTKQVNVIQILITSKLNFQVNI